MNYKIIDGFSKYKIFENGLIQGPSGKILKAHINNNYYRLSFRADNGAKKNLMIHRVMAHLYHGLALDDLSLEPDHLDKNKLNNHKDNLEIVTKSENCRRRSGREPNSNIDTATHKQCSKCLSLKPRSEYSTGKRCVDGIGSWCGECTKTYKREYINTKQPTKIVSEKQCTKCGTVKHVDYFSPSKGSADGFGSWCKQCQKEYRRAKNNP